MNLTKLITDSATKYKLKPEVVAAIILQESGGEPFAARFEKAYFERLLGSPPEKWGGWVPSPSEVPTRKTEATLRSMSMGLMQVMGDSARKVCKLNSPYLSVLYSPEINLDCGCMILAENLKNTNNDYAKALSIYNAGRICEAGLKYANAISQRIVKKEHLKLLGDKKE